MLIELNEWMKFCQKKIKGIIHIGAHYCEEQRYYDQIGVDKTKVIWIEAITEIVEKCKQDDFNIYNLVVSDVDDQLVSFKITNNGESSSMLDLDMHKTAHPHIHVVREVEMKTTRMDTFIKTHNIDMNQYNFLNLDIQGAELLALKGFSDQLKYIDYIYAEVNIAHLYKDCALMHEIDEYLETYGFERKITHMTHFNWGDALYVKK